MEQILWLFAFSFQKSYARVPGEAQKKLMPFRTRGGGRFCGSQFSAAEVFSVSSFSTPCWWLLFGYVLFAPKKPLSFGPLPFEEKKQESGKANSEGHGEKT